MMDDVKACNLKKMEKQDFFEQALYLIHGRRIFFFAALIVRDSD